MDNSAICFTCQDFKVNVGHETKWCPKNICKKCGQNSHTKIGCMVDYENLPLPNEILLKIFDYLDDEELDKCSKVSVKINEICDKLIKSRESKETMQSIQQLRNALRQPHYNTQQQQQQVMNILRANPKLMAAFLRQRNQQQQVGAGAQQGRLQGASGGPGGPLGGPAQGPPQQIQPQQMQPQQMEPRQMQPRQMQPQQLQPRQMQPQQQHMMLASQQQQQLRYRSPGGLMMQGENPQQQMQQQQQQQQIPMPLQQHQQQQQGGAGAQEGGQ